MYRDLKVKLYVHNISILAVKKAGHLNINTEIASEYSQRIFASRPIRTRGSKLFLC